MLKKFISWGILLLTLVFLSSASLHKFYVSHYTLDYRHQTLEITAKVFTDDLEKVLQTDDASLRIDERQDSKLLGKKISDYYSNHLQIQLDHHKIETDYVGYELDQDVLYVYMKIDSLSSAPKSLRIQCDALTESFPDQVNLFRVKCGSIDQTFFLNSSEKTKDLP
ncbi:MAG: hypothetical protein GC180_10320 [Bacteroidetes bacterium]|nr:hypothetical protein [Bacteroidota bacterium]